MANPFQSLAEHLPEVPTHHRYGFVVSVSDNSINVEGLSTVSSLGDLVRIHLENGRIIDGEIVFVDAKTATIMTYTNETKPKIGDRAEHIGPVRIYPSDAWLGQSIDALGRSLDGVPVANGMHEANLRAAPPPAKLRRALGRRLDTGLQVFDTFLPITKGQRIGIFAGSGIGKTTLLAQLARGIDADRIVIGLIGERGREVSEFINSALDQTTRSRAVIVTATSDQSPLIKRRATWTATSVAEGFRDQGHHVLLVLDSLTRFAEAHREVALTGGEPASLHAYPPSTANMIASLTERSGTGTNASGDITAVYSVLVAGSDVDEPVSDMVRGVLDGHVILERAIAERGRFPAINLRKSVSRSLPEAATPDENALLARARKIISAYENSELLIQTGLYESGTDPAVDEAIKIWPHIETFITKSSPEGCAASYQALAECLGTDIQT
jgi:flagellum-specific ATP synthase